jgi:hypothetical protein
MLALSTGAGESSDGAIKTQHRLTEGDRFSGLPTEGGNPGGMLVAEEWIPRRRCGPKKSAHPDPVLAVTNSR